MGNTFTNTYGGNTFTGTHSSSGNTFSNTYGSPVPSGGGGGTVHHASSGGGFFGSSVLGGIEHVAANAAGQAADIVHAIPNTIVSTPHMLVHTFGPSGVREDTGINFIDEPLHAIGIGGGNRKKAIEDPQNIIGVQAKAVGTDITALRRGDWHYFEKHPLNPVLDIAAVASLGGKGALGLAGRGALGERAATLARGDRVLTAGAKGEVIAQSRTLQGRLRQHAFDQFSQNHPDMPIVGVNARMNKILTRRAATMTLRAGLPVRDFQRVTNGLDPAEVFAFHVAAEGVPLGDRIAYYHAQLHEIGPSRQGARPIEQYLGNLESPAVKDVLENPRPEFIQALQSGKDLEARAGERLVQTGQLQAQSRAERTALPQRIVGGAEFLPKRKVTETVATDQHAVERKAVEKQIVQQETVVRKAYSDIAKLKKPAAKARRVRQAQFARDRLDGLRANLEAMGKPTKPVKMTHDLTPEIAMGPTMEELKPGLETNLVNPAFPAPYRFPHVGKQGTAGLFTAPKTSSMLGKAAPLKQLRRNAAVRFQNALLLTDPRSVLSTDFLQTMRHELVIQMQKESLDPISQRLDYAHAETGFKGPNEWYYRPSYDRNATAAVPRQVRENEALTQDQSVINGDMARAGSEKAGQGVVSQTLHGLGVDARDVHNLEKLNELGIRRVPAAFGKEFSKEFGGTHWALRYFYDRPLDVWRAITLNFRPAWAVNNFVGNGVMGLARYGPQGAATYLHMLLATEKGEQKVRTLWKFTMKHPTLRRKYAGVFQEVAPELHSAGLYGTQTRVTNPGVYEGKLAGFTANPAVKALGFVPKQVGRGVMKVGRGVTRVEILFAEDTGREAAFVREAGGDLNKIRDVARKAGEGNLNLAEALKRLDQSSVERAVRGVSDALGDFNDLSPFERSVMRRIIPFYSWFKVITKVSGKYAARYPARILLLKNIAQAQNTAGEPALPGWLKGSVLVGGPHRGVQTLLSTQGVNPFETLNQVATGGAGSVLSPFATAGIVGMTGRDPSFGTQQDYYGLGKNSRGGWLGQLEQGAGAFAGGLAPARVYSQTTGPYQGKLYTPRTYGHVGPVSINDFLLQYLGIPIRHVNVQEAKHESGLK